MAPPSYSDLGKAARDLFSKGYSKYLVHQLFSALLFQAETILF